MKKIIVEYDVDGFGKIQASELTVAELAQLSGGGLSHTPQLDNLLTRHGITTAALNKSLGTDLRDQQVVELRIGDSVCDGCRDCITTPCPVGGYNLQHPPGLEDADNENDENAEICYEVIPLLSKDALQGCATCGQCVEVCPQGVFEVVYADYRPSQLAKLVGIFNEVNPDFFLAKEHQDVQQKENLVFVKWEMERGKKASK
jgi:ferredoxin